LSVHCFLAFDVAGFDKATQPAMVQSGSNRCPRPSAGFHPHSRFQPYFDLAAERFGFVSINQP
jgi:hypothetical protein